MARWSRVVSCAVLGTSLWVASPRAASADESDPKPVFEPRRSFLQAFEVNGLVTGQMMPRPFFGFDGAYVIGNDTFQARIGAGVSGSPAHRTGQTSVSNLIYNGLLDVCAAKGIYVHRVRMCAGLEAGVWQHVWSGTSNRAYKRASPHVAGSLKADYQYMFTRRIGVLFGAGVSVPVTGPSFQGRDQFDRPTQLLIPGPIAGTVRLGASIRI